jgi:succinate dehydrogenase / fumarate reductase membrane anchor subunit
MGTGTQLGRVRGLGSAKSGAHHWWVQRVTAVANVLLFSWLVISLLRMPGYDLETMRKWLSSPLAAVPMMLLVANVCWHFRLGLQIFIEDYVHDEGLKAAAVIALKFYAVLKIAFTGVAA